MSSSLARRRFQVAAAVGPLILVITSALIWSGYATFHHAEGPGVPGSVAWTLVVALDGTVVVTTPVWLSTVLPARVRNYAGVICVGALAGSMHINFSETGWPGLFPPLIAGALIHLVGVVLRAFARMDAEPLAPSQVEIVDTSEEVEHEMPSTVSEEAESGTSLAPTQPSPPVSACSLPAGLPPQEIVFWLLNEAHACDRPSPTGPELTAAVRAAGHEVNDEYGRTTRARWRKAREEVVAS